jgi:hypothetical protein
VDPWFRISYPFGKTLSPAEGGLVAPSCRATAKRRRKLPSEGGFYTYGRSGAFWQMCHHWREKININMANQTKRFRDTRQARRDPRHSAPVVFDDACPCGIPFILGHSPRNRPALRSFSEGGSNQIRASQTIRSSKNVPPVSLGSHAWSNLVKPCGKSQNEPPHVPRHQLLEPPPLFHKILDTAIKPP